VHAAGPLLVLLRVTPCAGRRIHQLTFAVAR
jgi:hypothetical protein